MLFFYKMFLSTPALSTNANRKSLLSPPYNNISGWSGCVFGCEGVEALFISKKSKVVGSFFFPENRHNWFVPVLKQGPVRQMSNQSSTKQLILDQY